MYWKTRIDFTDEELKVLNLLSKKYPRSSESTEGNILKDVPFALEKINKILDLYLPRKYKKYLVNSWNMEYLEGEKIPHKPHNHGYAHLGFVFYTKSDGNNRLILMESNGVEFKVEVRPNDFIILPPYLMHTAEYGVVKSDRVLFSGDIILTNMEYELSDFLSPIEQWIELENG